MLSTKDFGHQVWLSLENIRERLAVLEAEVRHSRQDLGRLEAALIEHLATHRQETESANAPPDNGAVVTIKIGRKLLGGGSAAGAAAGLAALAKALGWW